MEFNTPTYISTQTTTTISTGMTKLFTVVCPIALTGTATFTDTAGTTYFVLPIGAIGSLRFSSVLPNGLKVVTSAGDKLIVNWNQ